ncbi:MAG TPA: RNA polymerase sigma factor SigM [Mycobacteriales bacterium]|nr:RNA polymerase sigma factor SigM [Mycobacteriales bacterium]
MSRARVGARDGEAATDRALLARHVAGDRDAFGELVRRHQDRLWRVALRTLGDAEDAADAVQDALVSAYRAAGTYRGEAAVTTWLHRIVVNSCLDLVRRRKSRPATALDEGSVEVPAVDVLAPAETAQQVLAALRQLPIEQAAAVVLVDVEGYPVAEAAAILEVPEGTVKSRCARARGRLAVLLGELGPDGGNPPADAAVQPGATRREPE